MIEGIKNVSTDQLQWSILWHKMLLTTFGKLRKLRPLGQERFSFWKWIMKKKSKLKMNNEKKIHFHFGLVFVFALHFHFDFCFALVCQKKRCYGPSAVGFHRETDCQLRIVHFWSLGFKKTMITLIYTVLENSRISTLHSGKIKLKGSGEYCLMGLQHYMLLELKRENLLEIA